MTVLEIFLCASIVSIFSCAGLLIVRGGSISHDAQPQATAESSSRQA